MEVDRETALLKPVYIETLMEAGSLTAVAEAVATASKEELASLLVQASAPAQPAPGKAAAVAAGAHTADFPPPSDGVSNDAADVLCLANTAPVALWVMGHCDMPGEYKTEVFRVLRIRFSPFYESF